MIIIRPRAGETVRDVLRRVRTAAAGAPVTVSHGGVLVDEPTALAYLADLLGVVPAAPTTRGRKSSGTATGTRRRGSRKDTSQ